MFSSYQLRALSAVAAHGSIAAAARALHMTPSGVSQQLAKLERDAGRELLEPRGRSVRLTRAGRVLAAHAERIVVQLGEAEAELAGMTEAVSGPLRIGGVASAVRELLPGALAALLDAHPRLSPEVRDGESVDLLPALLAGNLDLALVERWADHPAPLPRGMAVRPLVRERVRLAVAAGHRLAGRTAAHPVRLAELAGEVWTGCPPGTDPHGALVQLLRPHGIEPELRYALAEHPTQLALVARGLAVALVPPLSSPEPPDGVRFVPLRPAPVREVLAVWPARGGMPPVRACVRELARTAGVESAEES